MAWRRVQVAVVRDADDPRVLCSHQDVEWHAGGFEAVDHADPMGFARGISPLGVGCEHPACRQVLDAVTRVAHQVGQFGRGQALG